MFVQEMVAMVPKMGMDAFLYALYSKVLMARAIMDDDVLCVKMFMEMVKPVLQERMLLPTVTPAQKPPKRKSVSGTRDAVQGERKTPGRAAPRLRGEQGQPMEVASASKKCVVECVCDAPIVQKMRCTHRHTSSREYLSCTHGVGSVHECMHRIQSCEASIMQTFSLRE